MVGELPLGEYMLAQAIGDFMESLDFDPTIFKDKETTEKEN